MAHLTGVISYCKKKIYHESDSSRYSILLLLIAFSSWLMRRVSVFENLRRLLFRGKVLPAWFLDIFLVLLWAVWLLVAFLPPLLSQWWMSFVILYLVVQILQTSIYHELIRPNRLAMAGDSTDISHSRLRNLVICLCNYCFVTYLYGLLYWANRTSFDAEPIDSVLDAVYFASTIAWSAGSVNITPGGLSGSVKGMLIAQIVSSLILVGIIIAVAANTVRSIGEKPRSTVRDGA
jgi:hypothetical protein